MSVKILTLFLFLGFAAAQRGQTECRVCPERCQAFPREDSGCNICICDGVAKSNCERISCQVGCRKELDPEGCNVCTCDPICPAVPECPENCEQKLGGDGCIVCDCGDNNNICDAVPVCPKGCIDMRIDTKCFSCNCTLPEETFSRPTGVNPFGGNPFGGNPFGENSFGGGSPQNVEGSRFDERFNFFDNNNRRRPIAPTQNQPFGGFQNQPFGRPQNRPSSFNEPSQAQTSRCPAVQCPQNCRIAMDDDGCRQCLCGEDAMMCPGVSLCFGRCLTTDPDTNCCQCNCIEETEAAVRDGGPFKTTFIFTRNGITALISGLLGSRRPGFRPGGRPGQRPGLRPEQSPIIPNEDDAEGFSPQDPGIFESQNPFTPNGQTPFNTDGIPPLNPTFDNPAINTNINNNNNPTITEPIIPVEPQNPQDGIPPPIPNFVNPANPNENGIIRPFINPIDPVPSLPINPAIDPNNNNNNPTITEPVIPGRVEPQNPQNVTCPSVEEVTCGGDCQPRAGPDGCPMCDCGLLRMLRPRPVIIVDENAPPTDIGNVIQTANGDAELIPTTK